MNDYAWSESWAACGDAIVREANEFIGEMTTKKRVMLAAAAPTMARALCHAEWVPTGVSTWVCSACHSTMTVRDPVLRLHAAGCLLDAALSAAGLDWAKREEVRHDSLPTGSNKSSSALRVIKHA